MNRTTDALKDLNTAIGMDDDYIDYYYNRSYFYKTLNEIDKAEDDLDRALKCTKVSNTHEGVSLKYIMSRACCLKGEILVLKSDTEGALEWLSKAISENENNPYAHRVRGRLYKSLGKIKESEADLAKMEELEEKYPDR